MIPGQSDKNRLTTAFLGQKYPTGSQIGVHRDGMRSFEIADRPSESLFHIMAHPDIRLDVKRDNFRVGGNISVNEVSPGLIFIF